MLFLGIVYESESLEARKEAVSWYRHLLPLRAFLLFALLLRRGHCLL